MTISTRELWKGWKEKELRENPEQFESYGALLIRRYDREGRYYLKVWRGKADKPKYHYQFKTEKIREEYIQKEKDSEDASQDYKAKRRAEKEIATAELKNKIQVGTIFYSSWGYEQTNIDFYEVVEKKGSSVVIRELAQESRDGGSWATEYVKPIPGNYVGSPMLKRIGAGGLSMNSYKSASLWDGREKFSSSYH